eukprot:Gb_03388 [translate_table: standard]
MTSKENYRLELRVAVRQLRERGLYAAAKWAAEQLVGLEVNEAETGFSPSPAYLRYQREGSSIRRERIRRRTNDSASTPAAGYSHVTTPTFPTPAMHEEEFEDDRYMLGKAFFDTREYRRAAFALRDAIGKKSLFLRCYALFMAGEKRKEEETVELAGPLGKKDAVNSELVGLEQELSTHHKNGTLDAFSTYLLGIVLREKGQEAEARNILVESVNSYPWNWSAWLELQALCTDIGILNRLELKDHWMKEFFLASTLLELQRNREGLDKYEKLEDSFPLSDYVFAQAATAHYNLRDFDEAERIFEELLKSDPYRIEGMDTYSNILYVKESFAHLSHLAHRVFLTDKYRPESCCIIGNYYSLKAQHEKAVLYFKRALKLSKKYLSAWTLMGHEYVEMKNTPAAIDAYRRAIDINPRDYRAWYGLGQTYEIIAMPYYALYYYRQSAYLRPHDARMWIAIANCYESEQLHMLEDAIKCYIQALRNHDNEGIALHKLAKLHNQLGKLDEAAFYYKSNLEKMENEQNDGPEVIEALLYLANYYKNKQKFAEAEMYCTRLLDYGGPAKEDAKTMLRGLKNVPGFQGPSVDEQFTP